MHFFTRIYIFDTILISLSWPGLYCYICYIATFCKSRTCIAFRSYAGMKMGEIARSLAAIKGEVGVGCYLQNKRLSCLIYNLQKIH